MLFSFVNNDSIQFLDVLGYYGSQVHHYGSYAAARIVGNPNINPTAFAFYSELPDELTSTTAFGRGPSLFQTVANIFTFEQAYPGFDRLQRFLHSLDGGLAEKRRACLRKAIQDALQDPKTEPWELGFLNHAFGDSYAHSYKDWAKWRGSPQQGGPNPNYGKDVLYDAPFGHGFSGHAPDYPLLTKMAFC